MKTWIKIGFGLSLGMALFDAMDDISRKIIKKVDDQTNFIGKTYKLLKMDPPKKGKYEANTKWVKVMGFK